MGQYVSRGGKQYYKADDGKLYANFRDANLSSSPADQAIRGFGQALQGIPSTVQGAFANVGALMNTPVMRAAIGAPQKGPYDDRLNAPVSSGPTPKTKLTISGDADLGGDPGSQFGLDRLPPAPLPGSNLGATPVPSGFGRPEPIVQAADETYKTLLSQYGGAPGISQLAGMASLPTGFTPTGANRAANLKDYYAAQNLQGNANLGTIIKEMGYTGDMARWAQLHPGLAQEQYAKKQAAAAYGGYGPSQPVADPALKGITGSFFPGDQSSAAPIGNSPLNPVQTNSFSSATNSVPAPPSDTQAMLKVPFNEAINIMRQRQNPQNAPFSEFYNPNRV